MQIFPPIKPFINHLLRHALALAVCAQSVGFVLGAEGASQLPEISNPEVVSVNKKDPRSKSAQSLQNPHGKISLTQPDSIPQETIASKGLRGNASFYSPKFQGRKTATGEIFSNKLFTAASNLFPLGSLVIVKRPDTNLCVVVKVNDRMHARHRTRVIDLSHSAAKYLDMVRDGVVKVQIVPLPSDMTQGSPIDCAMGFEVEEKCENCDAPLQFNN